MAAIVVRFFLLLPLLFIHSPAEKYPMNAKFVKTCTDEHNRQRSLVNPGASNMYFMSWDAALAKTARAWSKTCNFSNNPHLQAKGRGHPVYETVGENIYAVSGSFSVKDAIQAWYNEGTHFDFAANKCNKTNSCKHYTQLVWGLSYKLGCAANHCPNGIKSSEIKDGTVFVCNYSPRHTKMARNCLFVLIKVAIIDIGSSGRLQVDHAGMEIVKERHHILKDHLAQVVVTIFAGAVCAVIHIVKQLTNILHGIQTLDQPPFYCQIAF
ncbi:glioma pathogenesis-related protein 1-like [Cetorhinus maximus]